jgi:hypothetical protein
MRKLDKDEAVSDSHMGASRAINFGLPCPINFFRPEFLFANVLVTSIPKIHQNCLADLLLICPR